MSSKVAVPFCTPNQQRTRVPIIPHPRQHLALSVFQILASLIDRWWYLIVVLVCTSLMTYDVEHLLICLFVICVCIFFGEVPVKVFGPFCNWVVHFLIVRF